MPGGDHHGIAVITRSSTWTRSMRVVSMLQVGKLVSNGY
ncbi:hypothetical protein [Alloactinosynnema sp. L-07]|nr:hypothetical protein [Alloactinosynnema sp. L-07]